MKIKKIKDVSQIQESPRNILLRKDFPSYVELPCLEACLYLYDMNIHTYSSGCNKVNYDNAHIMIYYDDLSDENKEVVEGLIAKGYAKKSEYNGETFVTIAIKTSLNDDIEKVSDTLLNVVKAFNYQDVLYGFKTIEEFMKENLEMTREFKFVNGELVPSFQGDYEEEDLDDKKRNVLFEANEALEEAIDEGRVDYEGDVVWDNKELFDKHIEYFEKKMMKGKI